MNKKKSFYYMVMVMGVIFLLSSIPNLTFFGSHVPKALHGLEEGPSFSIGYDATSFFYVGINTHPDFILHKLGHIVAYAILGTLAFSWTQSVPKALLIVIVYASTDEFHQSLVPGRSARFSDIVIDSLSAWLAIRVWLAINIYCRYKRKVKKPL